MALKKVKKARKNPIATIPESELWLFQNKAALPAVKRGLAESAAGKLMKRPSYAKHAYDELE